MSLITDELKSKLAAQATTLDEVSANVDLILAGTEGGATAEEVSEISAAVDANTTKIEDLKAKTTV